MAGNQPEEHGLVPMLYQDWCDVTFLHWRYDPAIIDRLLPSRLRADIVDGSAWVSLTPFEIRHHRPPGLPPLPVVSRFPETNVRTYARHEDGRDGLWFLSLDVASLSTVVGARLALGAPYFPARMRVTVSDTITYRSERLHRGRARHQIVIRPGPQLDTPLSTQDSLLVGRWRAFTHRAGRLREVPVEHPPWRLHDATLLELDETLLAATGLPPPDAPPVVRYAAGVRVKLGLPRLVHGKPNRSRTRPRR
jgi:uncharacterized protein